MIMTKNNFPPRHQLSEEQINLCRDIRRRGKNKVFLRAKKLRKKNPNCFYFLQYFIDVRLRLRTVGKGSLNRFVSSRRISLMREPGKRSWWVKSLNVNILVSTQIKTI